MCTPLPCVVSYHANLSLLHLIIMKISANRISYKAFVHTFLIYSLTLYTSVPNIRYNFRLWFVTFTWLLKRLQWQWQQSRQLSLSLLSSLFRGTGFFSCTPQVGPCTKSKYRSIDGSCNNLNNPNLGVANTPYGRLLPPKYSDGKQFCIVYLIFHFTVYSQY